MPNAIVCLFIISMGALVLAVAWHGYKSGEVRAGASGLFSVYKPNRWDNPVAFHFFLTLYFIGGMALIIWGVFSLIGRAAPIPLQ